MSHFNFSLAWFSWAFLVAYSKAKMKSNGDKAFLVLDDSGWETANASIIYQNHIHEDVKFERFELSSESFVSSSAVCIVKIKMYKVVILHVALYEFKILSLLLKEAL
jgi:hypothetical protein